jgi:hypothetical protein
MRLEFIPLWDLDEHWEQVSPLLSKALAKQSAMTLKSVYEDVRRAKFLLWRVGDKAAFVTEIQPFALEKICMIVLCGGDGLEEWVEVADRTLTRHAKALGCNAIMMVGRPGWSRVVAGYEIQEDVIMRKAL